MTKKQSVIPLILLILLWANLNQALQSQNKFEMQSLDSIIELSLPKVAMNLTDTLTVDIDVTGLSTQEVYSAYFRLSFDPQVISIIDVTKGQLTEDWNSPIWNIVNNEIRISHYGLSSFSDNGTILKLSLIANGEEDELTDISFAAGALNEGQPSASFNDGRVYLGTPNPQILAITDTLFVESDDLNIDIQVLDPLDRELAIELDNLPLGANFQDNGDGLANFSWLTDYYSAGTYIMNLSATNEDNLSSSLVWTLQIENTPQAPQIDLAFENIILNEDQIYEAYTLLDYVSDGDLNQGDSLFVSLAEEDKIFLTYENGLISFTPQSNWFGVQNVNLIISDTYGFEVSQEISVQVQNINDETIQLQDLPLIEIDEDYQGYSIDLAEYFSDIDNVLSYSILDNQNIDYQVNNGILSLNPNLDWFGSESIILQVREEEVTDLDGQILSEQTSMNSTISTDLDVIVNSINDQPQISESFSEIQVLMNESKILESISNYFTDVDSDLTYSFSGNNYIAISHQDDSFIISPNQGWVGVERVTVTASDDFNESVAQVLVIRVQAGFLYTEDFDHNGSLPSGWNQTGGSWQAVNYFTDDYSMRVLNPRISRIQRLNSQTFDLSGIYEVELAFDQEIDVPVGVTAVLQYSLNGFTYYNIESFTNSVTGRYRVSLPQVDNNSNVKFRWQYTSNTLASNYWKIDNLQLSGIVGNYLPPASVSNLELVNVTSNQVSLQWSPIENNFFNQYEISIMNTPDLNDQIFLWNGSNDNLMYSQETSSTSIINLNTNQSYYFAIRSSDVSGNVSEWSEIISATPSQAPVITFITEEDYWFANSDPIISLMITDDLMIDASTIGYRFDENNNGIYDQDEDWISLDNYQNSPQIEIDIPLESVSDGLTYKVEVRCSDDQNFLYNYSGSLAQEGIEDDFIFNIDTQSPNRLESLITSQVTDTSVTLQWQAYSEVDFMAYQIYFSTNPELDIEDNLYSLESDPSLGISSTNSVLIPDLDADQRYWFSMVVVDKAGNKSELSNTVTNVIPEVEPIIYDILPNQEQVDYFFNNRQVDLSCKISDAYGVDSSTVQYRIDANGNGIYDLDELWINVFSENLRLPRDNQQLMNEEGDYVLEIMVQAEYLVDGEDLAFEFRAKDINGYGYTYSGSSSNQGISDDWSLNIDSIFPQEITTALVGLVTASTVQIGWTPSSDTNFLGYRIYYGNQSPIGSNDDYISWLDYPQLANLGSDLNIFDVTNLLAGSQYYLKIAAVDIAGNMTFSEELSLTTSSDAKPNRPENIQITFQNGDLILSWDSVTQDTNGNNIDDVIYDIYVSEVPEFELDGSNYYDSTYENQYIFYGIGNMLPKIFFKVQAYAD